MIRPGRGGASRTPTLVQMSRRLRVLVPALLVAMVILGGVALTGGLGGVAVGPGSSSPGGSGPSTSGRGPDSSNDASASTEPTIAPTPTPRPVPGGQELYGYVPYWQMTGSMATYLRVTPLSTIALFSVTSRGNGSLNSGASGYERITGDVGRRIIADARARGSRVEIVFTSFGTERNGRFFGRLATPAPVPSAGPSAGPSARPSAGPGASAATPIPAGSAPTAAPTALPTPAPPKPVWPRTVTELVDLATDLGVDGINVDVEQLDPLDRPAYGAFLIALREALRAKNPEARVTVATEAGPRGVLNAAEAAGAGVDRVFLMGYDYHWSGSQPGASSPVDRTDGEYTLRWSIDRYVEAGVPRDRILLGLPLYGMRWRTAGPGRTTQVIGEGVVWLPHRNLDVILDEDFRPGREIIEISEVFWQADGRTWLVTFYDSPATTRPKLALAVDSGLAGAGFWAIGYERGIPGYLDLMRDFRDGKVKRSEAPPRP